MNILEQFKKGGLLKAQGGIKFKTTGGAGYVPDNYEQSSIDYIRSALYKNITPFGYHNPIQRTTNAILGKQDESRAGENDMINIGDARASALDAIWATYLNIPVNQRRKINNNYNLSKTAGGYYRFNEPGLILDFNLDLSPYGLYASKERKGIAMNSILGNHTVGLGRDNKGDYIYYSDSDLNKDGSPDLKTGWDINPYSNTVDNRTEETTESRGQYGQDKKSISYKIGKALFGNISDLSMGIGNPVPIYDKIYLDDYYKVPNPYRGGVYLPEVVVYPPKKKISGKILKFKNKTKK